VAVFMHLIGDVKDKDVVIADGHDRHRGHPESRRWNALRRRGGAAHPRLRVHGVLSASDSPASRVDSWRSHHHEHGPADARAAASKIRVSPVAPLLAEAIRRIHDEESGLTPSCKIKPSLEGDEAWKCVS